MKRLVRRSSLLAAAVLLGDATAAFSGYSADPHSLATTATAVKVETGLPLGLEWLTLIAIAGLSLAYWGWSSWWHHRHP